MNHLDVVKVNLPLKNVFRVSKGETTVKTNVITVLNNRYTGEAAGSVHYGPDLGEIEQDLQSGIEQIKLFESIDLEALESVSNFEINPVAKSALVGMIVNYLSGESKRYPWEILNLGTPVGVKSSITIGIEKPKEMLEKIKNCDYPIIKIKMGNEEDIMVLDILDQLEGKEIRVDANGGWTCAKAEEMVFHLSQKGVKIIEQPTDAEFVSEWNHIKGKKSDACLIMDEGLNSLEDYKKYSEFIDGVNIKMEKCGGIVEGIAIANAAREDGKKVMLGCMVESSIGIAQSLYMSSRADYYDLDAPLLLKEDIARGITYDMESIAVDREIIGGPKIMRDVIEKYISQ
ncbi:MAG: hypothetical protein DWP97_09200 [Calditrichaeota bacterium]|nr:MAG: hypothetical protein DWP97_09200 [Calditrichota bacterium]